MVRHSAPTTLPTVFEQDLFGARYAADDIALIERAWTYKADLEAPADLSNARMAAQIVRDLELDHEALAATLLLRPQASDDPAALSKTFGSDIASLVSNAKRMEEIERLRKPAPAAGIDAQAQIETLRQLVLAMAGDLRVILIKLAERTQAMRVLGDRPEHERLGVAEAVFELYAPLANRLGVGQLKWELEDLAFRATEPQRYKQLARALDEKRIARETYIAEFVAILQREFAHAGLTAEVSGRPKHLYSIWKKMQRKNIAFEAVYDNRAVRVIVDSVEQCYSALGIAHALWQPIGEEFDDYIAHPKANAYQSLHTAVIGPQDKTVEIQIRTHAMHEQAELGLAAHWRYKERAAATARAQSQTALLRELLAWRSELARGVPGAPPTFVDDNVYVLTPQGRVIDLPKGATPIDFAYRVHTELGHRCRGAKIDGHIVPLTTALENLQRVEIISAKHGGPSRDWLNASLGMVKTARARAKIRQWFKTEHFAEHCAQGRALLEREMARLHVGSLNQEKLAQAFSIARLDDFLAALGRGEISARQIANVIEGEQPRQQNKAQPRPSDSQALPPVTVQGVSGLLMTFAKCCNPVYPDEIVAFVTRLRGITVHRADCANVRSFNATQKARLLSGSWTRKPG